jgi:hypothetical protein
MFVTASSAEQKKNRVKNRAPFRVARPERDDSLDVFG